MADRQTYATFEDYWAGVVQKPFTTWLELEQTYHFVQEHAPKLMAGTLAEASETRTRMQGAAEKTDPKDILPADGFVAERVERPTEDDKRKGRQIADPKSQTNRAASSGIGVRTQRKIDRLAREFPDQFVKVKTGEVSVNRACIDAGFVKPPVTLPRTPDAAVHVILQHFQGEALTALIRGLAHHAGLELVDASGELITTREARRRAERGRDDAPRRDVGQVERPRDRPSLLRCRIFRRGRKAKAICSRTTDAERKKG